MENIHELAEDFRQHGGKFENVALGYKEECGFYLYTLDSEKKITVTCPPNLLVKISDVGVNKNGLIVRNPQNYGDKIGFLEKYFAFHFNKRMIDYYIEKNRLIKSLSNNDISLLSQILSPGWFTIDEKYEELQYARSQILNSHGMRYLDKIVLMPFMSFVNHSKHGSEFQINESGISISGKFSNEVFAVYNNMDTVTIAGLYGFVTDARFAYSIPAENTMPNGMRIVIKRSLSETIFTEEGLQKPVVQKKDNTVTINWFPLYIENHPEYPAEVAQMVADEIGVAADELLRSILLANYHMLKHVALELSKSDNSFSRLVAEAAQKQLEHLPVQA